MLLHQCQCRGGPWWVFLLVASWRGPTTTTTLAWTTLPPWSRPPRPWGDGPTAHARMTSSGSSFTEEHASSPTSSITCYASDCLSVDEMDLLSQLLWEHGQCYYDGILSGPNDTTTTTTNRVVHCVRVPWDHPTKHSTTNDDDDDELPVGATGRVVLVTVPRMALTGEHHAEQQQQQDQWQMAVCQAVDDLLYSDQPSPVSQPFLLSIVSSKNNRDAPTSQQQLRDRILSHVQDYGLAEPLVQNHDTPPPLANDNESFVSSSSTPRVWSGSTGRRETNAVGSTTRYVPTAHYELDGATTTTTTTMEKNRGAATTTTTTTTTRWDTSSVLVFDNLVSEALREDLLNVVVLGVTGTKERNGSRVAERRWDDALHGPDPARWIQGGLLDVPSAGQPESSQSDDGALVAVDEETVSYGLTDDALEELCAEPPAPALQAFESILTELLASYTVSRLPEAVLGGSVTPLVANAPIHGQSFDYHIDGDPYFTPPSPWTDVYGRYPNRAPGKPRFMSCILYLNDEWKDDWGAPTRFLDVATNTTVNVKAKPGRVILMDQDITHTVVAPNANAKMRPRYSLVWKLILHPKTNQQSMDFVSEGWPKPILVGSANSEAT